MKLGECQDLETLQSQARGEEGSCKEPCGHPGFVVRLLGPGPVHKREAAESVHVERILCMKHMHGICIFHSQVLRQWGKEGFEELELLKRRGTTSNRSSLRTHLWYHPQPHPQKTTF